MGLLCIAAFVDAKEGFGRAHIDGYNLGIKEAGCG
jgi:hypothetical protein